MKPLPSDINITQTYNRIPHHSLSLNDSFITNEVLKINIHDYENRKKERKERRNKFIENKKTNENKKPKYKEYHKKIDPSFLCSDCKGKILYTCSNNYYCICEQSKNHYDDIVYIGQPISLKGINEKASAPIFYDSTTTNNTGNINKYANTPRQHEVISSVYHKHTNNDNHQKKCCIIM